MENTKVHLYKTILKDRELWFDGDSALDEDEIINILSHGLDIDGIFAKELTEDIKKYNKLVPKNEKINVKQDLKEISFDWNIPDEYKNLNVKEYVLKKLYNIENENLDKRKERILYEYDLFKKHNLIDMLKAIIYIINTFKENNIVWGVGRGSSVASYILFLIEAHDINSFDYNLDIHDFLK